jgi:hypothetical protein
MFFFFFQFDDVYSTHTKTATKKNPILSATIQGEKNIWLVSSMRREIQNFKNRPQSCQKWKASPTEWMAWTSVNKL